MALQVCVENPRPMQCRQTNDDDCVVPEDDGFSSNRTAPPPSSPEQIPAKISHPTENGQTKEENEAGPWLKVGKNNRTVTPAKEHMTAHRTTQNPASKKQGKLVQQSKDTLPQHRRTVVLGDSNVHRLKRQLYKDVRDWRLRITTKSGATMEETLLRAESEISRAKSSETGLQLILHVGTTDILNERAADGAIQQLKQKLQTWSQNAPQHQYIIYGTPGLTSRGHQVTAACQEWNKKASAICCTMLGHQVEFVPITDLLENDSLSDIHYTESTGNHIGHLLAQKVAHF